MASTSYNTLTLSEEEPRKARSPAVYVVLGLAVVAMAGAAAVFATGAGHAQVVVDVEYSAETGMMPTCDLLAPNYLQSLPKYDEKVSESNDFYNACYYAFRCCSTSTSECMTNTELGDTCRSCLRSSAPRMVRPWCLEYAERGTDTYGFTLDGSVNIDAVEADAKTFTLKMLQDPSFVEGELQVEAMPEPLTEGLQLKTAEAAGTCWPQPGVADPRVESFAEKCFEVLSWCNLLCPRDGSNQNAHAMCKHCVLMDYGVHSPKIDSIKVQTSKMLGIVQKKAQTATNDIKQAFDAKYTVTQ